MPRGRHVSMGYHAEKSANTGALLDALQTLIAAAATDGFYDNLWDLGNQLTMPQHVTCSPQFTADQAKECLQTRLNSQLNTLTQAYNAWLPPFINAKFKQADRPFFFEIPYSPQPGQKGWAMCDFWRSTDSLCDMVPLDDPACPQEPGRAGACKYNMYDYYSVRSTVLTDNIGDVPVVDLITDNIPTGNECSAGRTFCQKVQWDSTFRPHCCAVGELDGTKWRLPDGSADPTGDEQYLEYCAPFWNVLDPLGACAGDMGSMCAGGVDLPDGTQGSRLIHDPVCSQWYMALLRDTTDHHLVLHESKQALYSSLALRWQTANALIEDFCTSEAGRNAPECQCYLFNGELCAGLKPGDGPCTFTVPSAACGNDAVARASLADAEAQAAMGFTDYVCMGVCEPPTEALDASGKLLTAEAMRRFLDCPAQVCYQKFDECISVNEAKTQGLINIGNALEQCKGDFGTIKTGKARLEFSVQHIDAGNAAGQRQAATTQDIAMHLLYPYAVNPETGDVLQDNALNGRRLVGMYMLNNTGNGDARLDRWEDPHGLPPGMDIMFPDIGAGGASLAQMAAERAEPYVLKAGRQLAIAVYLNKPGLGSVSSRGLSKGAYKPIIIGDRANALTVKIEYSVMGYKSSGRIPTQPATGRPIDPGTPIQSSIIVENPKDKSLRRTALYTMLGSIALAVGLGVTLLVVYLRRRSRARRFNSVIRNSSSLPPDAH